MDRKRYKNKRENKWYSEGNSMTHRINRHEVFSGVPSEEQLAEWGYKEFIPPASKEEDDHVEEDLELAQNEQ